MISLLCVNAAGSIWAASSSSLPMLIAAHVVIGMTSVGAQIIIPAVSLMMSPEQRGRAVGTVMSGLLAGILLARTLSGLVGGYAGWRTMYALAAGIDIGLIAVVAATLPASGGLARSSYGQLLRSLGQLLATGGTAACLSVRRFDVWRLQRVMGRVGLSAVPPALSLS